MQQPKSLLDQELARGLSSATSGDGCPHLLLRQFPVPAARAVVGQHVVGAFASIRIRSLVPWAGNDTFAPPGRQPFTLALLQGFLYATHAHGFRRTKAHGPHIVDKLHATSNICWSPNSVPAYSGNVGHPAQTFACF